MIQSTDKNKKFSVFIADKKPHLLGGSKCTYGPSYWCSHVDNAKDCDVSIKFANYSADFLNKNLRFNRQLNIARRMVGCKFHQCLNYGSVNIGRTIFFVSFFPFFLSKYIKRNLNVKIKIVFFSL